MVRTLLAVGIALFLLAALGVLVIQPPLSAGDVRRGLAPLATVLLERLQNPGGVEIHVTVPGDRQWMRIASVWGHRGILIVPVSAERPGGQSYNSADLGLSFEVQRNGTPLQCQTEDQPPYGYSAFSHRNGLRCEANPGDVLSITARSEPGRVHPGGNFAVFAQWDKPRVIDTTEAVQIARSIRRIAVAVAALGGVLIAAGVWLRRSAGRPAT